MDRKSPFVTRVWHGSVYKTLSVREVEPESDERSVPTLDDLGSLYMSDGVLRQFEVSVVGDPTFLTAIVCKMANDETCGDEIAETWQCSCGVASSDQFCDHIQAAIDYEEKRD